MIKTLPVLSVLAFGVASASAAVVAGQSIGIDFANGPNTPGAGIETNFNLMIGNGSMTPDNVVDTAGVPITGVGITITGANAASAQMGENNLGFGAAGVGDYTGTPFSDLSFNDGIFTNGASNTISITLSGLNNALSYDVLAIATGPTTQNTGIDVTVDGTTESRPYNDFRVGNVLNPLSFTGASTDGSGSLVVDWDAGTWFGISALHVTATPEPSVAILGAFGFLALLRRRR